MKAQAFSKASYVHHRQTFSHRLGLLFNCSPLLFLRQSVLTVGGSDVMFPFETLLVYQKSVDFTDDVFTATEPFSRGYGF